MHDEGIRRINNPIGDRPSGYGRISTVLPRIVFSESGSFIINGKTGDKLKLRENGRGSYIMDVNLVGGGKGEITVDSGAEESVCPKDWASRFRVNEGVPKLRFRGADGNLIKHHGERLVVVTSEGF